MASHGSFDPDIQDRLHRPQWTRGSRSLACRSGGVSSHTEFQRFAEPEQPGLSLEIHCIPTPSFDIADCTTVFIAVPFRAQLGAAEERTLSVYGKRPRYKVIAAPGGTFSAIAARHRPAQSLPSFSETDIAPYASRKCLRIIGVSRAQT